MRAAAVLLAALALAGATTLALAAEVTREEFVERAEPICKVSREESGRILAGVREKVKAGKLKPAAVQFEAASKALEGTRKQLAALPRPAADAARLGTWLTYMKQEAGLLGVVARKLRGGEKGEAERIGAKLTTTAVKANNEVAPFEFHYCVASPSQFT